MIEVEILYFAGCPAYRRTIERAQRAAKAEGLPVAVRMVLVRHAKDARALNFRGSPTVRVGGRDIDPEGAERSPEVGLYSRSYRWKKKEYDAPPEEMIREALRAGGLPAP